MNFDLTWLIGRTLTRIEFFGHGTWCFGFEVDAEIQVNCPWRLIRDGGITLSSEDHGHRYGLPHAVDAQADCRAIVGGAAVRDAEIRDETRDILLTFASGARLEILPLSSGYESWELGCPSGLFVVAQGGGKLAVWSEDA